MGKIEQAKGLQKCVRMGGGSAGCILNTVVEGGLEQVLFKQRHKRGERVSQMYNGGRGEESKTEETVCKTLKGTSLIVGPNSFPFLKHFAAT